MNQRTLLEPGKGIVRSEQPVTEHAEYPLHMAHPGFRPGVVGPEVKSPHGFTYNLPGEAIRFPPVLVNSADQEAYHTSQGYQRIGKSDPAAFARAVALAAPQAETYVPVEYPKWVNGQIANSAEEEAEIRGALATHASTASSEPESGEPRADAEGNTPIVPEMTPAEAENVRLKAELAEMRAMLEQLTAPVVPSAEPEPEAGTESPREPTQGEKIKTGGAKRKADQARDVAA